MTSQIGLYWIWEAIPVNKSFDLARVIFIEGSVNGSVATKLVGPPFRLRRRPWRRGVIVHGQARSIGRTVGDSSWIQGLCLANQAKAT